MTRAARFVVVALVALTAGGGVFAADVAEYEAVLVPFHSWYQTAGGDVGTELWLRNDGDVPIHLFPAYTWAPPAPCIIGSITIQPHSTLFRLSDVLSDHGSFVPPQINTPPGAFLWIEREGISSLTTTALILARPSFATASTTAYPLVPVARFRSGPVSIPFVHHTADSRYMVRLYGGPATPAGSEIRVNIYGRDSRGARPEVLRSTQVLALVSPPDAFPSCFSVVVPDVAMKPSYAQTGILPPSEPAFSPELRIEFVPSDAAIRYWAVVSATDNATNAITLYTVSN